MDAAAIAAGTPALTLMQRAGAAAYAALRRHFPEARRILVLCGWGNNGGDGYVVATLARRDGLQVTLLALDGREPGSEAALAARSEWLALGEVGAWRPGDQLPAADLVVDALFGVGLSRPLAGSAAALVEQVNALQSPVLALDVPSGIDADRGSAPGPAIRADLCISFVGRKIGLYTGAGRAHAGHRLFDDLGLGADAAAAAGVEPAAWLIGGEFAGSLLAPRRDDDHKGRFGHVLAVGGDHGMGGAVRLCAEAAARCGAGLVSVLTRSGHVGPLLAARPELMVLGVDQAEWPEAAGRATVLALGPGLGRGQWGAAMLDQALSQALPSVLDADALWHLDPATQLPAQAVLTPHPGEAGRLLGCDSAAVQADRPAAVRALVERTGASVVLKGNGSLVLAPGQRLRVIDAGNPGMASGGMGDVLTGVIAALLAQGMDGFHAAVAGALLHAAAGDLAAAGQPRGLLASDLFPTLRRLVNA